VQVLKECIARAGSVQEGLRHYVGASLLDTDGGYAARVMAEQDHMRKVADGKKVPPNVRYVPPKALEASLPLELPPAALPADENSPAPEADRVALLQR
jgi:hypothetical protein